jgi:hypothetical protein
MEEKNFVGCVGFRLALLGETHAVGEDVPSGGNLGAISSATQPTELTTSVRVAIA